jgi:hypothetical protein
MATVKMILGKVAENSFSAFSLAPNQRVKFEIEGAKDLTFEDNEDAQEKLRAIEVKVTGSVKATISIFRFANMLVKTDSNAKANPTTKEYKAGTVVAATNRDAGRVGITPLGDFLASLDTAPGADDIDLSGMEFVVDGELKMVNTRSTDPNPKRRYRYQLPNYTYYPKYREVIGALDREDPDRMETIFKELNTLLSSELMEGAENDPSQIVMVPVLKLATA